MTRQEEYKAERKYKELEKQAKVLHNATSTEELAEIEERSKQMMAAQAKITAAASKKQRTSGTRNEKDSDGDSDSLDLDISSSSEEEEEEETEPVTGMKRGNVMPDGDSRNGMRKLSELHKNRNGATIEHGVTSMHYIRYFAHDSDVSNAVKAPKDVYEDIDPVEIVSSTLQETTQSSSSSTASLSSKQLKTFSLLFRTCYGSKYPEVSTKAFATISNPQLNKLLWFPCIDEINSSLEFFKATDSAYFMDSDTSTSHIKRKEPDQVHLTHNLKNWLRALTAILDRYCTTTSSSGELSNIEPLNSSTFQQVLYAIILLNGFDNMTNLCDDLPRTCLESLLKVASQQASLYIPTQKVLERIGSIEEHTMPMLFSFAKKLLNLSPDPRFCRDFCFVALERLHKYLPIEVRSKLDRAKKSTLFEMLMSSLQILIDECSNSDFVGDFFEILLYTMETTYIASLLCSSNEDDDDVEDYDNCMRAKNSERWRPIINELVPTLSKKMQDDLRGKAKYYKLIPLVENLEEAVKTIYNNQQLQSFDEEEMDKY